MADAFGTILKLLDEVPEYSPLNVIFTITFPILLVFGYVTVYFVAGITLPLEFFTTTPGL